MHLLQVQFYDETEDQNLKFAVIAAQHKGQWVFCKHKSRTTYELPGGHREENENIFDTAKRELFEETGALDYCLQPICVYAVTGQNSVNPTGQETYGMLYYADIARFSPSLHSEIAHIVLLDTPPENWTYPEIQPKLLEKVLAIKDTPAKH